MPQCPPFSPSPSPPPPHQLDCELDKAGIRSLTYDAVDFRCTVEYSKVPQVCWGSGCFKCAPCGAVGPLPLLAPSPQPPRPFCRPLSPPAPSPLSPPAAARSWHPTPPACQAWATHSVRSPAAPPCATPCCTPPPTFTAAAAVAAPHFLNPARTPWLSLVPTARSWTCGAPPAKATVSADLVGQSQQLLDAWGNPSTKDGWRTTAAAVPATLPVLAAALAEEGTWLCGWGQRQHVPTAPPASCCRRLLRDIRRGIRRWLVVVVDQASGAVQRRHPMGSRAVCSVLGSGLRRCTVTPRCRPAALGSYVLRAGSCATPRQPPASPRPSTPPPLTCAGQQPGASAERHHRRLPARLGPAGRRQRRVQQWGERQVAPGGSDGTAVLASPPFPHPKNNLSSPPSTPTSATPVQSLAPACPLPLCSIAVDATQVYVAGELSWRGVLGLDGCGGGPFMVVPSS